MHQACLTDLAGIHIGHYSDHRRPTGCTVVLCPEGATAGVAVVGAAPGTRETDLLNPAAPVSIPMPTPAIRPVSRLSSIRKPD